LEAPAVVGGRLPQDCDALGRVKVAAAEGDDPLLLVTEYAEVAVIAHSMATHFTAV